jgi:hypothetical protein
MKHFIRPAVVGLILLGAAALPLMLAFSALAGSGLPVKATYEGQVTEFKQDSGLLYFAYQSTGTSTLIGLNDCDGWFLMDLDKSDLTGSAIVTAADGDRIFLDYVGGLWNDPMHVKFMGVVVGGDGRFAHSSGTVEVTVGVTPEGELTGQVQGSASLR